MPLPAGGTWPPAPYAPIFEQYRLLDTWYQGDPDRLSTLYSAQPDQTPRTRPSQRRGGLLGKISRFFWGEPTPVGQQRRRLHVPIASDIATMSSDLLFSEPPSINVTNPETQAAIDDMIPGLQATLLGASEIGAALGGYFLRAVWDSAIAPLPWLDRVDADAAVPEFRWGKLWAVTFWRTIEDTSDGKCLLHLERHEPGWIFNGLYLGTPGTLGEAMPLTAHPETAHLEPAVATGLTRVTAVYVPNMLPNRDWRTSAIGQHLGRSDFAGPVLGFMDALDETWAAWMRDVRLGKARLIVPSAYLQSQGPGQGATFDLDRELYEGVNMLGGDAERLDISPQQMAIRVAEHRDTCAEQLAVILRATGYSAQSFGLSGEVAVTATEVTAKERRSLITKSRKALYSTPELEEGIEMILQLRAGPLFSSDVVPERPQVNFGDSVAPDIQALATTAELMRRAEAASDETLVRMLHPDWDATQVSAEVDRLAAERGGMTDPIERMTGLAQQAGALPVDDGQDDADGDPDGEE
ncbi:hypothetical protein [Actinomadura terrae]|uniref:hypothetical protein n=1 Tax=Actinomadura terrae TaxID=604353 RepID=UPI001FA6F486|nr:hypothetical protein [Actinomadura terrae]